MRTRDAIMGMHLLDAHLNMSMHHGISGNPISLSNRASALAAATEQPVCRSVT